jgi:predicted O-methyltransferase YrrM
MPLPYPINSVRQIFTDRQALQDLFTVCSAEGARVGLIGFNEYSKHLVNLCGDNIVGIYDPAAWKTGISFRGKLVAGSDEKLDITQLAVCDPLLAYDFAGQISLLYDDALPVYIPPRFGDKSTLKLNAFTQEQIYKDIFSQSDAAPLSMINHDNLCFLMEMLRYALRLPGDVIEVGVWQGGSAWYLAKVLEWTRQTRNLYLLDPFEKITRNHNATMCNDEIARSLGFYPHVEMLIGFAHEAMPMSILAERRFAFVHCDLGFQFAKEILQLLWERLAPGGPIVLDNYSILAAQPSRLERFFAERGARVIRLPWSEQGLVFKNFS